MSAGSAGSAPSSLAELAQVLATQETVTSVLARLVETACALLPDCTGASVTLIDRGRATTAFHTEDVALELDEVQYAAGTGPCLEAIRTRKTVFWAPDSPRWKHLAGPARRRDIEGILSVPLAVGDIALGGLNLYSTVAEGLAAKADHMAMSLLATQGAVGLATAQAFEAERRAALAMQRSLLPGELAATPGYELAARYHPASVTAEVGGDWYDAFRTGPDGPLAAVVGDVAGHGLGAASLMGQVRTGLRAYALEGRSPTECLALLSRLLEATGLAAEACFATACLVLVDTETGMCRVANAGHMPPAIREPDGNVEFVAGLGGPPLGIDGSQQIEEDFVALNPGSVLVLYTDGLVEDRHRSIGDGLNALADVLAKPVLSACELCDRLVDSLLGGRIQEDDVALLVLRRLE